MRCTASASGCQRGRPLAVSRRHLAAIVPPARRTRAVRRCRSARTPRPARSPAPVSFQRASGACSSTVTTQPLRPLAAQGDVAHPRHAGQRRAGAIEVHREERAGELVANDRLEVRRAGARRADLRRPPRGRRTRAGGRATRPAPTPARRRRAARAIAASAFICRASSHMARLAGSRRTEFGERHAGLPRRHRHQPVAGHAGRGVDLEELRTCRRRAG